MQSVDKPTDSMRINGIEYTKDSALDVEVRIPLRRAIEGQHSAPMSSPSTPHSVIDWVDDSPTQSARKW